MPRKYLRITEMIRICGVDTSFVKRLERELISPVLRRSEKLYPLDQVDRVRVARLLMEEMGVNLEGAEVALHMREQMIAMQRQFNEVLRLLGRELKKKLDSPDRNRDLCSVSELFEPIIFPGGVAAALQRLQNDDAPHQVDMTALRCVLSPREDRLET